jgi:hypothetical protein
VLSHVLFQLDFFRQWQAELTASYDAASAAGFDEQSVAHVETVCDRMTQVWWHVGQLKPAYLCYLAHVALPDNSGSLPLWREIAEELLPEMDKQSINILVGWLPGLPSCGTCQTACEC